MSGTLRSSLIDRLGDPPGRRSRLISCGFIFLVATMLVAAVYVTFAPVIQGGFAVLDDGYNIFLNSRMGVATGERVAGFFGDITSARRYMPIGWLGLSLVFTKWGIDPSGYHAASLIWHSVSSVFLFLIAGNFFGRTVGSATEFRRITTALLVAAAWALHPLRGEAVAWASGMIHSQTCAFAFMAIWFWTLRWSMPVRASWLAAGAGVALTLSLLTYPLALGAAVVCWLLDRAALPVKASDDRSSSMFARFNLGGGIFALAAIVVAAFVATMMARTGDRETFAAMPSTADFGLFERGLQALYMWGHYFVVLGFPFKLSPIYTTLYSLNPAEPQVYVLAGFSLVGMLLVLWFARRNWTMVGWLAAYTAMAVPLLGLTEHPWIPHDRYASLLHPVLLIWAGSALLGKAGESAFRSIVCAASLAIFAGAVYAHGLTKVWATPENFTARLEQVLPANAWAGHYLGKVPASDLFLKGRFDEISPLLDRAEARAPGWSAAPLREEYVELIKKHREFLNQAWPGRSLSPLTIWHFVTGQSFQQQNDWATAAAHFRASSRLDAAFTEAIQEEAWCELEMNRPVAARATMERAIATSKLPRSAREHSFWRLLTAVHRARGEAQAELQVLDRAKQREASAAGH